MSGSLSVLAAEDGPAGTAPGWVEAPTTLCVKDYVVFVAEGIRTPVPPLGPGSGAGAGVR